MIPGRGGKLEALPRRLESLSRAIDAQILAAAQVPSREERPFIDEDGLNAGEPRSNALMVLDAMALTPITAAAYRNDPLAIADAEIEPALRHRHDACVPLTHWVCDAMAELDAFAILLDCPQLGALDAAIADALDDWTLHGKREPLEPRLATSIGETLVAIHDLLAAGEPSEAVVPAMVALSELMRGGEGTARTVATGALERVALAAERTRRLIATHRHHLATLGAAIDRATGTDERIELALGIAARIDQVAVIAGAIAAWLPDSDEGPLALAHGRWRRAAVTIAATFAQTLAGVHALVPLPT